MIERGDFDEFLETGKQALRKAGEKASELADAACLRMNIRQLKGKIALEQRRLGKLACACMDRGELTFDEQMQAKYNTITDLEREVESLEEEL